MGDALVPYQMYTYFELLDILGSGRINTIRDMAERWHSLHRTLAERAEALKKGLDRLDDAWEGAASESYLAKMRQLEDTIRGGAEAAKINWTALEDAADTLEQAQHEFPPIRLMDGGDAGTATSSPSQGDVDIRSSRKQAIIARLYEVDQGYYAARDRLQAVPYEGPPPDAELGGGPGEDGRTELSGSPGVGGGTAGGTLAPGPGAGGGGAVPSGRPPVGGVLGGGLPAGGAPVSPAAAARTGAPGRGAMPMGGGPGSGGDQVRRRKTWLLETDDVWGNSEEVAPRVLGFDPDS